MKKKKYLKSGCKFIVLVKGKAFLKYSIQTWIILCFLIAFGLELLMENIGKAVACTWCEVCGIFVIVFLYNTSLYSLLYCLRCS